MRLSEMPESLEIVRNLAASRSRKYPWARDEIVSNCNLALVQADQSFDASRGVPWEAYLIQGCELAVLKALRCRRLRGNRRGRTQRRFSELSHHVVAAAISVTSRSPVEMIEARDLADRVLSTIHARQREVVWGYLANGETFEEIGKRIGLSKERTRQIYAQAVAKIHERHGEALV